MTNRLGGEAVEMGGSIQHFHPIARRKRYLEKKASNHVGGGANHTFGPVVLRGCRGTRATTEPYEKGRKSMRWSGQTRDHCCTWEHGPGGRTGWIPKQKSAKEW
jgi:hypothetical protein